jgi:hypothetical protein
VKGIEWVQQRNEVKLGLRYFLLPTEQDLLVFHRTRFSILWRGRYDAVFDARAKYRDMGYNRDDFRFPEGKLPREMFLDTEFVHPFDWLSFRFGKQQVVWGEADLFRSLDVINPLRLDQNGLIGENFDEYREPLWIAKGLARLPDIPFLASNVALEFFGSPNSRPLTDRIIVGESFRKGVDQNNASRAAPGAAATDPRSAFTFPNWYDFGRVRHPWEISRVGTRRTEATDQADLGGVRDSCADGLGCADFLYLINNGIPTRTWDPDDAGMVGARLLGQTFAGIDFTLNWVYKKTEVPGTALSVSDLFDVNRPAPEGGPNPLGANFRADQLAQAALAEATLDTDGNGRPDGRDALIDRCINKKEPVVILEGLHGLHYAGSDDLPPTANLSTGCELVGFWYPWEHILGATATYNDFDFTGAIFRLEASFATKEPRTSVPPLGGDRAGQFPTARDFDTHLKRTTQVYRSMIGFDYLRTLWPRPPDFIRNSPFGTLFYDQWFFTFQFFNEYYSHVNRQIGLLDSVTDRMQHFNPVLTFLATGFFDHNRLRPSIAVGYDVNAKFPVTWVYAEYFLTPKLAVRLTDIEYIGSKDAESFLFLHKYADRDQLSLAVRYFFL